MNPDDILEDGAPLPDQDDLDRYGEALGVTYARTEELYLVEKELRRDRHRWELDPASAEDYRERVRGS